MTTRRRSVRNPDRAAPKRTPQGHTPRFVGAALAVGLLLSACGDKATETTGDTAKTGKNAKTDAPPYAADKLPADWPDDVPVYEGAKVLQVITGVDTPSGKQSGATFEATAAFPDVIASYKEKLPADGWQLQADVPGIGGANVGQTLLAKKGDRNLNILFINEGAKTDIAIDVTIPG